MYSMPKITNSLNGKTKTSTTRSITWAVLQNDRSFEDSALNPSRVKLFKISSVERTVEIPWLCAFQFLFWNKRFNIWHRCKRLTSCASPVIPFILWCYAYSAVVLENRSAIRNDGSHIKSQQKNWNNVIDTISGYGFQRHNLLVSLNVAKKLQEGNPIKNEMILFKIFFVYF